MLQKRCCRSKFVLTQKQRHAKPVAYTTAACMQYSCLSTVGSVSSFFDASLCMHTLPQYLQKNWVTIGPANQGRTYTACDVSTCS